MRKKGKALLAALLPLLVLTGCGADSAAQPEPVTVAAAMAEITAEKIDDGFTDQYPHITVEQLVTALHDAVSCEITKEEAEAAGCGQEDGWCVIIPVSGSPDLGLSWDKTLDIVQVIDTSVLYSSSYPHPEGSIAYFRCHALYQLVRHCRDYDEVVDQTAYAAFKSELDARMQRTLDTYATNPGEFHAYQLTRFTKLWQYATEDGNRAEVYPFDYALIPDKPLEIGWAGGVYLDSQLRMQGFNDEGKVVARYKDDAFLGLVFMSYDDLYWTLFDEDWEWANDMLAAMEDAL